jgi:hypothetical protein
MHRLLLAALGATYAMACPRPPAPTPAPNLAPAPVLHVPPGCEENLSGDYVHAVDPSFRYRAADDGGMLSLTLERLLADGGVAAVPSDGGAWVVLFRTPQGFAGMTFGTGFTPGGHACPVAFPTEVVQCLDAGLALRAATTAEVNEECQIPQRARPLTTVEHHLLRPGQAWPPTEDAGSATDAGGV